MIEKFKNLKEFATYFQPYAMAIETRYQIPWTLTTTQAAHETNNGNSILTMNYNNLFGVTADADLKTAGVPDSMAMVDVKAWLKLHSEAPIVIMRTPEQSKYPPQEIHYWSRPGDVISKTAHGAGSDLLVERPFRTYESWTTSVLDWTHRIIRQYPLAYAAAMAKDAPGFFQALQAGGYATNAKYAEALKAKYSELSALV